MFAVQSVCVGQCVLQYANSSVCVCVCVCVCGLHSATVSPGQHSSLDPPEQYPAQKKSLREISDKFFMMIRLPFGVPQYVFIFYHMNDSANTCTRALVSLNLFKAT